MPLMSMPEDRARRPLPPRPARAASFTPPALPRPPTRTWALMTTLPAPAARNRSAAARASSACGRPPTPGRAGPGRRAATWRRLPGSSRRATASGSVGSGRGAAMVPRHAWRAGPMRGQTSSAGRRPPSRSAASLQSGHGPPSHPDPRRRHRTGAGGGDHAASSTRPASASSGRPSTPARPSIAEYGTPLPEHVLESIRRNKVALKGPITTPVGDGLPERQRHAAPGARPVRQPPAGRSIKGLETRYEDVDLVIVRENTEDLYAGIEHMVGPDAAESIKIITRARVRADRPLRLRVRRRERPAQGHRRPQGEHHEAVRRPVPRELPDGRRRVRRPDRVRGPDRRQHVHAARPEARPVRRARPAEPVRRHRQRPRARAWSAASAWRRAPTSARRRPSSSRSTAPRPSTPARTRRTRRR